MSQRLDNVGKLLVVTTGSASDLSLWFGWEKEIPMAPFCKLTGTRRRDQEFSWKTGFSAVRTARANVAKLKGFWR